MFVCRDFFGPTFSGIVTKQSSFAWTMTYYSFGSVAIVVAIMVLKLYRGIKVSHRKSRSHRTSKTAVNFRPNAAVNNDDETKPLLS